MGSESGEVVSKHTKLPRKYKSKNNYKNILLGNRENNIYKNIYKKSWVITLTLKNEVAPILIDTVFCTDYDRYI